MQKSFTDRALHALFKRINQRRPWYRLPTWVAILNFIALRNELRAQNLHDTEHIPSQTPRTSLEEDLAQRHIRTADGVFNDLQQPHMGKTKARFGRNFALHYCHPEAPPALYQPSPRLVSQRLLARDHFTPATTLNLLAAAWIQFQTHDWFNHGAGTYDNAMHLELADGDPWFERRMRIPRTPADPTRIPGANDGPPTFVNNVSHWWDASAIYGSTAETVASLRAFEGGKLKVENGMLLIDPTTGKPQTGFNDNWWVGLTLIHTLFTLEHNTLCDYLKGVYPTWSDEQLFQKARLINAALMAKIHTVEWTPAILAHPALYIGMNANWWGLAGERLYKLVGRLGQSEVIIGIMGSPTDHHGASFALTEEFAAVYRMHPLLPDELAFYAASNGQPIKRLDFMQTAEGEARKVFADDTTMADGFYSFGIAHPGAIQLHNFPNFLRDLTRPNGQRIDLGAVDVLRDRERGIPRYNQFRELIHLPRLTTFAEITDNKQWAVEMREVYEGDVNRVDLMVGMFAEPPPPGFGFSDTALRVFMLMASRRLKSDRFFTVDYTPQVYTPEGMRWINDNTMITVLLRHYPQLQPALAQAKNAFAPWRPL